MRFLFSIFTILMLCGSLFAGGNITTRDGATVHIRKMTGVQSTSMCADTTIHTILAESVLWTSIDVGGVEAQFRIVTVADQAWYDVPDTVTEVVAATLLTEDGKTKPLKAVQPPFTDELDWPEKFGTLDVGDQGDDAPLGYHYWSDTLQLIPIPTRVDTVILKCWVEHHNDSSAAYVLQAGFMQAAIDHACAELLASLGRWEESDKFMARYEAKKALLREKYMRKFDVVRPSE